MDTVLLLQETFEPLAGRRILDIGCGGGLLAKALFKRGAFVSGIDPDEAALSTARALVPEGSFLAHSAYALPFAGGSFDGSVFLNSLHHVPCEAMADALREAGRVTREDGRIVVIEPLASGSFFEAFLPVEDETDVRKSAQQAVDEVLTEGAFRQLRSVTFDRAERFAGVDEFLTRVTAGDPARQQTVAHNRALIEESFGRVAKPDDDGRFVLVQPLLARVLAPRV
jgi:SAM-dependent methyltransferase